MVKCHGDFLAFVGNNSLETANDMESKSKWNIHRELAYCYDGNYHSFLALSEKILGTLGFLETRDSRSLKISKVPSILEFQQISAPSLVLGIINGFKDFISFLHQ